MLCLELHLITGMCSGFKFRLNKSTNYTLINSHDLNCFILILDLLYRVTFTQPNRDKFSHDADRSSAILLKRRIGI